MNRLIATVQHLGEKATGMRVLLLPSSSCDSRVIPQTVKKARKESKYEIGSVVAGEVYIFCPLLNNCLWNRSCFLNILGTS